MNGWKPKFKPAVRRLDSSLGYWRKTDITLTNLRQKREEIMIWIKMRLRWLDQLLGGNIWTVSLKLAMFGLIVLT